MATIKDVAAHAGVSIGTVSNVLNGKTNNPDLIRRVEASIKTIGFRPDAKARSLKNAQTRLIGILVGTLEDRNDLLMISAIQNDLKAFNYSVLIKTTDNNDILEQKYIEYFLQLGVDGLIVNTSVRYKKWMEKIKAANVPVVFTNKLIQLERKMDVIQIDYSTALKECLNWMKERKARRIALILEKGLIDLQELEAFGTTAGLEIVGKLVGDNSLESGFKAAYEVMYEEARLDAVIYGSYQLAQGGGKAIPVFENEKDICKVCIKADNWIEDEAAFDGLIEVSHYQVGTLAAARILEKIKAADKNRTHIVTITAEFKVKTRKFYNNLKCIGKSKTKLNVAILDAETAAVLAKLAKIYEQETGVDVAFHPMKYHDLWQLESDPQKLKDSGMDILMYDVIWKESLAKQGVFVDISKAKTDHEAYFEDFIDNIVESYGEVGGSLYGLPFLTGTQLLFYQKDLFEDQQLKLQFLREFGYELKPPADWNEYHDIANFFTRSFNPQSPVKYGTALINDGNIYNSIEFLNRFWSYEGVLLENNRLIWDNSVLQLAMEDYKTSFQFTDQSRRVSNWEDIAGLFMSGDIAMAILYDSYAFGINDSMRSRVAGNIGSSMIPGGVPVLGGWGLAVSVGSQVRELAADFLLWSCGRRIANPFAVLSGISSRKSFYLNRDLDRLYPWKQNVLESYARSRMRPLFSRSDVKDDNIVFYDDILGGELGRFVRGESGIERTIEVMKKRADKMN